MARKASGFKSLRSASTSAIQAELDRRRGSIGKLARERGTLAAKLARLDAEISKLGGEVPDSPAAPVAARGRRALAGRTKSGAPRKRPKNDMNLVEALKKLLTGKTMSVTEAGVAVQKAGYKTSSANFRTIVNQTLIRESGTFKKVSRGQYTAR